MSFRKHLRGTGYLISNDDMPHVVCGHGHIYYDRGLVASLDSGTRSQCRTLQRLGEVVRDGDLGELSVMVGFREEGRAVDFHSKCS